MDLILSLISLGIFLVVFLMIYGKLSAISSKLDAQSRYYEALEKQNKPAAAVTQVEKSNQSFEEMFGKPKE